MDCEDALVHVVGREPDSVRNPAPAESRLTARGETITHLIGRGLANGRIAEEVAVSERTVEWHVANVLEKLGLESRLQVAVWAVERSLAAERLRPFDETLARLWTIPGVGRRIAEIVAAEIGLDVGRFPSAAHLAAWAGLAPGNHESAGKRLSGKTRQRSVWLRTALVDAAQATGRTKDTYLAAQYRRLAARRGAKRAAVALGHTILVIIYHLLTRGTVYQELGAATSTSATVRPWSAASSEASRLSATRSPSSLAGRQPDHPGGHS